MVIFLFPSQSPSKELWLPRSPGASVLSSPIHASIRVKGGQLLLQHTEEIGNIICYRANERRDEILHEVTGKRDLANERVSVLAGKQFKSN